MTYSDFALRAQWILDVVQALYSIVIPITVGSANTLRPMSKLTKISAGYQLAIGLYRRWPCTASSFNSHLETLRSSQLQKDSRDGPGRLEAWRVDTLGRSQPSTEIVVLSTSTTDLGYVSACAAEAQGYRSFATPELTPWHHGVDHLVIFMRSPDAGHGLAVLRTIAERA